MAERELLWQEDGNCQWAELHGYYLVLFAEERLWGSQIQHGESVLAEMSPRFDTFEKAADATAYYLQGYLLGLSSSEKSSASSSTADPNQPSSPSHESKAASPSAASSSSATPGDSESPSEAGTTLTTEPPSPTKESNPAGSRKKGRRGDG